MKELKRKPWFLITITLVTNMISTDYVPDTEQSTLYLLIEPWGHPGYGRWGDKEHSAKETLRCYRDDTHPAPSRGRQELKNSWARTPE